MKKYTVTINGNSLESKDFFEVKNPATDEVFGYAPISDTNQIEKAISSAKEAQPSWAAKSNDERKDILMQVAKLLEENTNYLAEIITKEQGKPLAGPGSVFEMQACVGFTQVPASLDLSPEVVFEDDTRRDELHRKPLGVVGAIAPWNWPLMIAIWQIMPALRVGNTVVIKPSEYTPIGTLEMVRLINTILPPGVLNTISGDGSVGKQLIEHKDINKIMFTGSTETGRKIIAASSNNMARLTLECGGNDAGIILPGTDIKAKGQDLFWGSFINMGQTCACLKRLYVHEDDHDEVVETLNEIAAQVPMGNGMDEGIVLGPIQNKMQFDKVTNLVNDAKANGATIVCGGQAMEGNGNFYPITLVTDVDNGVRIVDEEQFGPVLPIIKYKNIDDAVAKANASEAGLGASVWGDDQKEVLKIASKMQAGTVWTNQHGVVHPMVPFGGAKKSGYGSEFGLEGLKALTQPQIISMKK